jgi:hypothetical protein
MSDSTKRGRPEQIQANCAFRAQLWREFLASYQSVLEHSPEKFSDFCAAFRERFVQGDSVDSSSIFRLQPRI